MTCIITSETAGDITINGHTVSLVAGENAVEITYVEDAAKASFSLQCGTIAANTISVSGLTFTEV
jgi:hypothetical protein